MSSPDREEDPVAEENQASSSAAQAPGEQQNPVPVIYANDMTGVKPPSFDWEAPDLSQHFQSFRKYCQRILRTPTYACRPKPDIVNYILLWMGPTAVETFDNWTHLTEAQKDDPAAVWKAFEAYFEPKSNFRLARFQLRDMRQGDKEPIDVFMTRLYGQARKCKYEGDALKDHLIDQLIKGVAHEAVRKKLLDHDPSALTLDKCVDYARTFEATNTHMQQFAQPMSVNAVHRRPPRRSMPTAKRKDKQKPESSCFFCGGPSHARQKCPAKEQTCNKCGKVGHWGKVCKASRPGFPQRKPKPYTTNDTVRNVNTVNTTAEQFETLNFDTLTGGQKTEAFATIDIAPYEAYHGNTTLRGKVDTGAQGNILPIRTYRQMYPHDRKEDGIPTLTQASTTTLSAYNGSTIPQFGTLNLPCRYGESQWHTATFYVAKTDGPVIFGLPTSLKLGLVEMNCAISTGDTKTTITSADHLKELYPDRFEGIGKMPGQCKLFVKENAQPVIHPPRKAPIQLREKIKAELERMLRLGVIRKVNEPTDWVSSITYVTKQDGSLRICLDPKDLNNVLKRAPHLIPTMEELAHKFGGAQIFSKLDAKSGYWSISLDPESQLLTTFNTPFGRYCFLRLPFGLNTSQDTFQCAMDQNLEGLDGVVSIADDIAIFGTDEQEHDQRLHKLMQKARERGIVFNQGKCTIKTGEITFFGNIYSKDGVRPDPERIQAINDLKAPKNVTELQSMLGVFTYLAPYIPNLSEHTAPLRKLLQQDVEFQWNKSHDKALKGVKQLIQQANALCYFDPNKDAHVQVDASLEALGAALIQDDKVIAYASKSLTDTEKRYANIERELLACVFGAERFHTYLFGKHFIIESDHKPLEMISKKNLAAAPARLQRMLLRLQRYDYEIKYRPGKEMVLADSLSRSPNTTDPAEINLDVQVNMVQFSRNRLEELREHTQSDPTLCKLTKLIVSGLPESRRDIHPDVRPYWSFRDELSIDDGLILKGNQVVIPLTLRNHYLNQVHTGHQGVTRCQQRARSCIYWPNMNREIQERVQHCPECQKFQASQPREPLMPVNSAPIPWHTLGTDLFTHEGKEYLIVSDYFSKYTLVEHLTTTTSQKVADTSRHIFASFGIPNTIISENGPQFIGAAYQQMLRDFDVTHITSSPHHPMSHGFIERQIRSVKAIMRKSPQDTDKALLMMRNTPLGSQLPSPAEILFGRRLQTNLPIKTTNMNNESLREFASREASQGGQELPELQLNQPVLYQDVAKRTWHPGTIVGHGPEPRSYTVLCESTQRPLRRNRVMLRPFHGSVNHPNLNDMTSDYHAPATPRHENKASAPGNATPGTTTPASSDPKSPESSTPPAATPAKLTNAPTTRSGRIIRAPKRLTY